MPRKVFKFSLAKATFLLFMLMMIASLFLNAYFQDKNGEMAYRRMQAAWVDSVFNTLTEREKIGQLFSIRAHSNLNEAHHQEVEKLIREYKVGGLTFFQGGPYRQAKLTNRYQKRARIPLLVAIDGEWGLGMRLDSTIHFPRQMTLGAIQDDSLIYEMGKEVAYQFRRVGIHVNFAPVVDVNNNPRNPVIGDRSFGEDKENVARKGIAYMLGMQDHGLIANAKHFPGHGDTDQDSHYTLPTINHPKSRLEELELYPFQRLIEEGLMSTMVAHLRIPAYDSTPNRPTTLSPQVVSEVLQEQLGFEGLVFTDALEMKGVTKYFQPGEISVLSLLAGNDILLLPESIPTAYQAIVRALAQKRLTWEMIDAKVKKVLRAKYFAGLHDYQPISLKKLSQDLNSPRVRVLRDQLYEKAFTLVKNEDDLLPFEDIRAQDFASVALGVKAKNAFQSNLDHYAKFEHFQIPQGANAYIYQQNLAKLKDKKMVVVALQGMNRKSKENFGLTPAKRKFIQDLAQETRVVLVVFGSPYVLKYFAKIPNILVAYEDKPSTLRLAPQVLFGALSAKGKLPVSSGVFAAGTGLETPFLSRLSYGSPEEVGMRSDTLARIDALVQGAIRQRAMPGCQVLIARKGKVVWHQAYGYQTYSKKKNIHPQTLYDVASITKVTATLQAITYLYNQGKIDLDTKVSEYLEEMQGTNKADITIREVLTHQAGLVPYLPYWDRTVLKNKVLDPRYYSRTENEKFTEQVAQGIYTMPNLEDTLWRWTLDSKMSEKEEKQEFYEYEYSDLSFYVMKRLAEHLLEEPIEDFLQRRYYTPLGMYLTTFNPLEKFDLSQIPPTEKDTYFRQQLVQGTVHDQGAAMLGGVGGHAGLFSTANDLAKFLQMYLNGGHYGNRRYLLEATIDTFTRSHYPMNRRGLGWDRPDQDAFSYISDFASDRSFGHSGFTGCVLWADPNEDLLMVFLSNRIYPSVDNRKLITEHIRRRVQNLAYRAIVRENLAGN